MAFRNLASILLHYTILSPTGGIRLFYGPGDEPLLGGWERPGDPLPLTDGCYLRVTVTLYLEDTPEGMRMKVRSSSYQYQMDREGDRWIFRYDFLRSPPDPYPAAHLQIRGKFYEACLPEDLPLERIHLPTGRVSLEAVIRLLANQFHVPCHSPPEIWQPLLTESERAFLEIAHRPLSGPEA